MRTLLLPLVIIGDWISPTIAVMVGLVVTTFIALTTRKSAKRGEIRDEETAHDQEIEDMVREMHRALVTPPVSDLHPNPPKGIVDTIAEMKMRQLSIDKEVMLMKDQLQEVTKQMTQNGGKDNTLLDRVGRIEDMVANSQVQAHVEVEVQPVEAVVKPKPRTPRKPRTVIS